jgi:hypothetical protein
MIVVAVVLLAFVGGTFVNPSSSKPAAQPASQAAAPPASLQIAAEDNPSLAAALVAYDVPADAIKDIVSAVDASAPKAPGYAEAVAANKIHYTIGLRRLSTTTQYIVVGAWVKSGSTMECLSNLDILHMSFSTLSKHRVMSNVGTKIEARLYVGGHKVDTSGVKKLNPDKDVEQQWSACKNWYDPRDGIQAWVSLYRGKKWYKKTIND